MFARRPVPAVLSSVSTSVLAAVLSVSMTLPASATEEDLAPNPLESGSTEHSSDEKEPVATAAAADTAAYFTVDERTFPVAPGLTHTSFDRYDERGWIRVDALTADLSTPELTLDYASAGKISSRAPLSNLLRRDRAVAGVNGDFFDISDTGAPLGVGVDRQRGLLHAPAADWNKVFMLDADNSAKIVRTFLQARIVRPSGDPIKVTNLNSPTVAPGGIGIYTSAWGGDSRARVLPNGADHRQVIVRNGRVRDKSKRLGAGPIDRGTLVLVGTGRGARMLGQLRVGQRVDVEYGLSREARVAVGGNVRLVRNGEVVAPADPAMHPRTAIGIDEDTNQVLIVTVDGRSWHSRGLTFRETALLMQRLGAEQALNLDGGGSSSMIARESGEGSTVVNQPSDGGLRSVPNGLGFAVADGSGRLRGIRIEPVGDTEDAHRVLRGLSRRLVARGHDETFDPVRARPGWDGTRQLRVRTGPGRRTVVVGRRPGSGVVTAAQGPATGEFTVRVLGRVHRLETSVPTMAFSGRGGSQEFDVRGYDVRGFGTWVEPRDVRLSYDRDKLAVRRTGRGFTVTSLTRSASDVIEVSAGGQSTYIGVTIGLDRDVVDRMNGPRGWETEAYPGRVDSALRATRDRRGRVGKAIALRYDFRRRAATRAAYLVADPDRGLPARARRIGLWVRGDGKDAWLRMRLRDAAGTKATVNLARHVRWKGWRRVTVAVPGELTQPLELAQVYAVETNRKRRYRGTLAFDDLTVWSERVASVPATAPLRDALVADLEQLEADGVRVAVIGDAGIRGSAPNSAAVTRTRQAMRQAVASGAELVLINGDLVRRGSDANLDLARRLITEELEGKVAWRYVPGDRELGGGSLADFGEEFGAATQTFDQDGTRFVLLNSAHGSLRLGGFEQLVALRRALDSAEADPSVSSLMVVAHHPTSDPNAGGTAELADPREGDLVEGLLADFRARSRKPVSYVASHTERFGLTRDDGVPNVYAGPVNDAANGGRGSFMGWTMLRVDPSTGALQAAFTPFVDSLRARGVTGLRVGESGQVFGTVYQGRRRARVEYPMAAEWLSTGTVHVGPESSAPRGTVAVLDAVSGQLTALRAGEALVRLRVNGVTAERTVTVLE